MSMVSGFKNSEAGMRKMTNGAGRVPAIGSDFFVRVLVNQYFIEDEYDYEGGKTAAPKFEERRRLI